MSAPRCQRQGDAIERADMNPSSNERNTSGAHVDADVEVTCPRDITVFVNVRHDGRIPSSPQLCPRTAVLAKLAVRTNMTCTIWDFRDILKNELWVPPQAQVLKLGMETLPTGSEWWRTLEELGVGDQQEVDLFIAMSVEPAVVSASRCQLQGGAIEHADINSFSNEGNVPGVHVDALTHDADIEVICPRGGTTSVKPTPRRDEPSSEEMQRGNPLKSQFEDEMEEIFAIQQNRSSAAGLMPTPRSERSFGGKRGDGLEIGMLVRWTGDDEEVPKGSIGKVVAFDDEDKVVNVHFAKDVFSFMAEELKVVSKEESRCM